MMKHEFEARIGTEITAEQYGLVEYVYMYSELDKDDVANIWKAEGPARIEAMAYKMKCAESEKWAAHLETKVEMLSDDIGEYKKALDAVAQREQENNDLREMVAKLEAELREACVALFRAQREVA